MYMIVRMCCVIIYLLTTIPTYYVYHDVINNNYIYTYVLATSTIITI